MIPAPQKKRAAPRSRRQTISGQLKAIIRERELTSYAVAVAAEISPSVVTRFVNGERGLSTESLDSICLAMGLELKETRRGLIRAGSKVVEE